MIAQCWPPFHDVSPPLVPHWVDVSRLLGWSFTLSLTVTTGKLHFVDKKMFNAGSHRRRWTNNKPTHSQCLICVKSPSWILQATSENIAHLKKRFCIQVQMRRVIEARLLFYLMLPRSARRSTNVFFNPNKAGSVCINRLDIFIIDVCWTRPRKRLSKDKQQ